MSTFHTGFLALRAGTARVRNLRAGDILRSRPSHPGRCQASRTGWTTKPGRRQACPDSGRLRNTVALSPVPTAAPALKSPRMPGMRAAALATVLALGTFTASSALLPQLHSGYGRSALLVALETAASLTALLAAFLV